MHCLGVPKAQTSAMLLPMRSRGRCPNGSQSVRPASMIIMSNIIETLLLRNLQEVFGEGDPARRRAAISELYTEDCTVLLPIGRYVGHQALDQVAGELRAGHPSFVYTPHSAPQAVQDGGRIAWGSGPAGEPPRYTGLDVIIVRDGKIAALYVFLDSLPV